MISSRRFREKTSAPDRHDGRSSGRRADKPDSPAARRGNAPYASRQTQHPFSADSRGRRHQPFTPSSSPAPPPPARRGRCAPCPPTRTVDPTYAAPHPHRRRDAQPGSVGFAAEGNMGRATPEAWSARLQRAWGRATSGTAARPWGMVAYRVRDTSARRAPAGSLKQVVAPDLMGIPLRLPR